MELTVETFDRICRACLRESTSMKSLFTKLENNEHSLLDLFNLVSYLDSKTEDGLPKQVCVDCEQLLYKTDEFRTRCHNSDTLLKRVFENSTQSQYYTAEQSESDKNENKDKLYLDKLSGFDLQEDDNKDLVEFSHSFGTDVNLPLDSPMLPVKKENDIDFGNDFADDEPLDKLTNEFKEEPMILLKPKLQQKKLNTTQWKKLQWKKKKKILDNKLTSLNFSCEDCKTNFENMTELQNHLETHIYHIEMNKNSVKKLKLQEVTGNFQCSLCFRSCKTKKTLSKHLKLHEKTDNIKYSCDKCKREFKYKSFLESHVISVHMHNNFPCHLCPEKFLSKENLEAHLDSHVLKKKHVCKICGKAFLMLCTLNDHMRKHTGEKPFLCCTCGKGFSQKTNLAQHTRRHLGVKPFKCDICSKTFVSKGELDAHTRKHSGAHPFVCDECGGAFTTSSALVKHRRTHTGERPYACDLCPMRFAASGTLKNHRRTHTGERPFQCSLCEKAFVQRTDLISHIRCHTGERPYICSHCGQAFRKAAALKTHLKMHGSHTGGLLPAPSGQANAS